MHVVRRLSGDRVRQQACKDERHTPTLTQSMFDVSASVPLNTQEHCLAWRENPEQGIKSWV